MTEQTNEQLRAELAQAREELAWAKEEANVWFDKLMQAREELKGLQGANKALGKNRDYWYDKARGAEAERHNIRQEAQAQSDEVQHDWLSPCQKAGLEQKLVEAIAAQADAELAAHVHDKACGELAQTVHTERALRQEAEQRADDLHTVLYEIGAFDDPVPNAQTRATRAEALAQLVTPGLVELLERLAGHAWYAYAQRATGKGAAYDDRDKARKLATEIREAL